MQSAQRDVPSPPPARKEAAGRGALHARRGSGIGTPLLVQSLIVIAAATLMGFWGIDQANVGADESIYQEAGLRYVQGDVSVNPEHPPVAKFLLGIWQLQFGAGITSARALMGVVLVLTALVAYLWMRAAFHGAAGALAAIVLATTHRVTGFDLIDRQVLLDPFSVLFGMSGLALLWQWERSRRLPLAICAGLLLAFAILSKASAATLLIAALACVPWRDLRERAVWTAMLAFAGTGVTTCLVVYAPLGGIEAVRAMVDFQSAHAAAGHPIVVAGTTYLHAPWYALAWFAGEVVGWPALAALGVAASTAIALGRRDRATRVLAVAAGATLLVLSASPVALPHYTAAWLWPVLLLSGVGLAEVWRRAHTPRARSIAVAFTAAVAIGPVTGLLHVLTIEPTGVGRIDEAMRLDPGPDGTVLTLQLSPWITDPNIEAPVTADEGAPGITAVAVGDDLRFPAAPGVLEAVAAAEHPVRIDDLDVYLLNDELSALLQSVTTDDVR